MVGFLGFLFIYITGGLTLIPAIFIAILTHAYLTFPVRDDNAHRETERNAIVEPGDDQDAIKRVQNTLGEKFQPKANGESETSSGYFYCSREYIERWWLVQGKPPERVTPVGSTTVSAASPSVYQSMYRSIFERKPVGSPIDNKVVGKPQKRGGNYFYIVLRHGHLMLFDDEEQLEVRHVVSLAHHSVSCYSGGGETPEGELFIKRNALCLSRRTDVGETTPDGTPSKPFFLYSENCSAKEDFYFAMLRNQERDPEAKYNPPIAIQYDVKDIITLVQKLHSSEEQLQTRWLNAIIGRIFLGLYKTPDVTNFIRALITKKISRVKTPSFLSKISLRHLDMGEAAPVITNPRLKDLTVDGEMVVEFDAKYSGNFRLEVATTARIELGARFKAREVNLLLAVLIKRVEGHAMIRIKPPPSNRIWLTFVAMPKIDMQVEPIVSARQITYTLILRQIENRIKEVVAESLVFPNWDDFPFFRTEGKPWRGGIWTDNSTVEPPHDAEIIAAQDGDVDEVANIEAEKEDVSQGEDNESMVDLPRFEKSINAHPVDTPSHSSLYSRKTSKSMFNIGGSRGNGSSTSVDSRASAPEFPRILRTGSFTTASTPTIGTDATHVDAAKYSSTPPDHSHAMAAVSALSQSPAPIPFRSESPTRSPRIDKQGSLSSVSSNGSNESNVSDGSDKEIDNLTSHSNYSFHDLVPSIEGASHPPSPARVSTSSLKTEAASSKSFGHDPRRENSTSSSSVKSGTTENKRLTLAAVSNAAANAKKWGFGVLQRQSERSNHPPDETPSRPLVMGRGQPLPPPGVPLPHPDRKTKTAPIPVPKRKALPPPQIQSNPKESGSKRPERIPERVTTPPTLPKRRESVVGHASVGEDGIFVVAAPIESEPNTPSIEGTVSYMPPWVDEDEESDLTNKENFNHQNEGPEELLVRCMDEKIAEESFPMGNPPPLPRRPTQESIFDRGGHEPPSPTSPPHLPHRRPHTRTQSSTLEEDSHHLPSWELAQEGEARTRSSLVDEDGGL